MDVDLGKSQELYKCQALIRVDSNAPSHSASALQKSWRFQKPIPWDNSWHFLIPCKHGGNLMSTKDIFGEFNDLIKKKVVGAGAYLVRNIAKALSSVRLPKRDFFCPFFPRKNILNVLCNGKIRKR